MTQIFNIFTTFSLELIYCADINLCHSDLFPTQTELKVIGHHHTYVRPKLKVIGHFVRRPCKRYFKAWNFSSRLAEMKCLYGNFTPGGFWLISKALYFVSRVTFVVTRGLSVVTRGQNHNPNKMNTHYIPLPNVTLGCKVFINL
jgi:hypothetical protein